LVGEKATINTSSTGAGSAGSLAIKASNIEVIGNISSSVVVANQTTQQGVGGLQVPVGVSGEVNINTNTININSGSINVRNLGTNRAGTLKINADSISLNRKGSIRASTASGEGGNISLDGQKLQLNDSYITATAGGNGNGGNININADTVVILGNSNINANAFEGRGGKVKIDSQGFFLSPDSKITASSERGINGSVQINTSQLDVVNSGIVTSSFNPTVINNTCSPEPPNLTNNLSIAGKGGIPQGPSDLFTSIVGWADQSVRIVPKQSEQSIQPNETQNIVVAQGWKDNGDGTVSFTITPDPPEDVTSYSSPLKSSCLHPKSIE
jgi:large exoprotein involved in heme utilization and adhesion